MNATLPSTRPAISTSILFSYSQVHDTNAGIASQPRTVEVDDGWRPPPQRIVPNAPDCGASTTQPLAFTCLRYEVLRPSYVVSFGTAFSSVRAWSIWSYTYVAMAVVVIVPPSQASDS